MGPSGDGGDGRGDGSATPGKRMRGAACGGTRRRPPAFGPPTSPAPSGRRSGSRSGRLRVRGRARGRAAAAASARSAGCITTAMPRRRSRGSMVLVLRPGLARAGPRHGQTVRGRDDQPPGGSFGRTQQPQYGEPEMAGQGGHAGFCAFGCLGHSDEHGHDALQSLTIPLDCRASVHAAFSQKDRASIAPVGAAWIKTKEKILTDAVVGLFRAQGICLRLA